MDENNTLDPNEENEEEQTENVEEQQEDDSSVGSVADFAQFEESSKKGYFNDDKIEFLKDLNLNVYIELGRTKMIIKDILELERGYVIELDKLASEPVDVYVNNKKIAEGEVVVIDKHFGIRITNLIDTADRLKGIEQ
jgi:flagellar motor switch protein FliN/FliY